MKSSENLFLATVGKNKQGRDSANIERLFEMTVRSQDSIIEEGTPFTPNVVRKYRVSFKHRKSNGHYTLPSQKIESMISRVISSWVKTCWFSYARVLRKVSRNPKWATPKSYIPSSIDTMTRIFWQVLLFYVSETALALLGANIDSIGETELNSPIILLLLHRTRSLIWWTAQIVSNHQETWLRERHLFELFYIRFICFCWNEILPRTARLHSLLRMNELGRKKL